MPSLDEASKPFNPTSWTVFKNLRERARVLGFLMYKHLRGASSTEVRQTDSMVLVS